MFHRFSMNCWKCGACSVVSVAIPEPEKGLPPGSSFVWKCPKCGAVTNKTAPQGVEIPLVGNRDADDVEGHLA
jgi:hypothetical protein